MTVYCYRVTRICLFLLVFVYGGCGREVGDSERGDKSNMIKEQKGAPIIYVALGDSTGVGVGARRGGGYVARLFERIERVRPGSRLINLCVSGATTADVLRGQVPRVTGDRPSLITLGIGINDVGRGVPVEQFARNYEEIVERIQAKTNAPFIITNLPDVSLAPSIPAFMRGDVRRRLLLCNERIEEIARRHGLLVVDAYTMSHDSIPSHPEFFSPDGFHPSEVGYEYWAKTMWPTVKKAIGENSE